MNNKPTYLSRDGLEKLRSELDEMVSIKRSEVANRIHDAGLLLVIRTLPGSAHAIAAALDRARWPEVAGSIAGDDTLFVAFADRGSLQRIKRRLIALTGGPPGIDPDFGRSGGP